MITRIILVITVVLMAHAATAQQPLLTLKDAIAQALKQNFGIRIADNDATIAEVQNNWGNAGRYPTVAATADYNFSSINLDQRLANGTTFKRDGASFQRQNVNVNADWAFFSGFRVVAAKERLEQLENIGKLNVRQQANEVAYNVIRAYLDVYRLEKQKEATEETMELVAERMRLAENRFNIGVAAKSDYLQAVVDYNQAKNSVIGIDNNIAQSKTALNNLLARDPQEVFDITDTIVGVGLPDRSVIMNELDTLSPLLLINKSQLLVLIQQKREINAQRLPTASVGTGFSLSNSNNSAGFTLRNTTYGPNAGVGLRIPIFQGGVVKQQLKVNDIQQQSQQISYEQLQNDLRTALANAYNDYEFGVQQLELEKENLKSVEENSFIAMERFRKADITNVELRQTQLNLIESQTRRINALYQMKLAQADILLILGKLVE